MYHRPNPCQLSFNVKKQFDLLQSEYIRIGEPLKELTLVKLVAKVDVELSRNQTFLIVGNQSGPDGETQFLANRTLGMSWWIPSDQAYDETVHKRADGAPFLFNTKTKASIYCIDLQKDLMQKQESAASAGIPLPGAAGPSGTDGVSKDPPPVTHGAVPLPGAVRADGSLNPTYKRFLLNTLNLTNYSSAGLLNLEHP